MQGKKTLIYVSCKDITWTKITQSCLSSYPAGRCLWFRIFKENQTVPNQHHPGRTPILPATQQTHVYLSDSALQIILTIIYSNTIFIQRDAILIQLFVFHGSGLMTPHLSFRPPSAIFVLFRRPAFSNSSEHNKRGLKHNMQYPSV